MDRAWAAGIVQGALEDLHALANEEHLPKDALLILTRNLFEGKPLRDIASELGMPLATCHRRCAHARTALQESIAERLRLVGELGPSDDSRAACDLLLAAISHA